MYVYRIVSFAAFQALSVVKTHHTMSGKVPVPEMMRRLAAAEQDVIRLRMRRYRRRNAAVGLGLVAGVLGIYAYSMLAVKQESFLDEEFDNPKENKSNNTTNR